MRAHDTDGELHEWSAAETATHLRDGTTTSVEVTEALLARIASIDAPGSDVELRAVLAVASDALDAARTSDDERARRCRTIRPARRAHRHQGQHRGGGSPRHRGRDVARRPHRVDRRAARASAPRRGHGGARGDQPLGVGEHPLAPLDERLVGGGRAHRQPLPAGPQRRRLLVGIGRGARRAARAAGGWHRDRRLDHLSVVAERTRGHQARRRGDPEDGRRARSRRARTAPARWRGRSPTSRCSRDPRRGLWCGGPGRRRCRRAPHRGGDDAPHVRTRRPTSCSQKPSGPSKAPGRRSPTSSTPRPLGRSTTTSSPCCSASCPTTSLRTSAGAEATALARSPRRSPTRTLTRDAELRHFGHELFDRAAASGGRAAEAYGPARERNVAWATATCLEPALASVDLVVAPSYGPAWKNDLTLGGHPAAYSGICSAPSIAGWPIATVPMGLVDGLPVGLSLVGRPGTEPLLLAAAAALEHVLGLVADGALTPSFAAPQRA